MDPDLNPNDPEFWNDERNKPSTRTYATTYKVEVPGARDYWALVEVYPDGYTELRDWQWGQHRYPRRPLNSVSDQAILEAQQDVWVWLSEWELVELKPIGPEDSEYFATEDIIPK